MDELLACLSSKVCPVGQEVFGECEVVEGGDCRRRGGLDFRRLVWLEESMNDRSSGGGTGVNEDTQRRKPKWQWGIGLAGERGRVGNEGR